MRHLGKLAAVAIATLALITPAATQADPGVNFTNYSDGSVEFVGKTTCSWNNVVVNAFPPATVTVPANSVVVSCTGGYWGNVNANIVVTFDDNGTSDPADDTATVQSMDVTGGALFFSCRYLASNLVLHRTDNGSDPNRRDYAGGPWEIPLNQGDPSLCSDPAVVKATVTFRRVP